MDTGLLASACYTGRRSIARIEAEIAGAGAPAPPDAGTPRVMDPTGVREQAAAALDDNWPDVLKALRAGLEDKDARKVAAVAVSYVQLVYGRQLQQPVDEEPADPLDGGSTCPQRCRALAPRGARSGREHRTEKCDPVPPRTRAGAPGSAHATAGCPLVPVSRQEIAVREARSASVRATAGP